jgi:hypothetical protein
MGITVRLARAWAPGAVTCLVLLGSATGALPAEASAAAPMPTARAGPGAGQSVPHPGTSSFLDGISCTSPSNCWAVGGDTTASGATLNQALHWNGRTWSQVPAPSPGGTANGAASYLNGVACASPASCVAVGDFANAADLALANQALHWNGRKWSQVPAPSPGGTTSGAFSVLNYVRCTSSVDCWAVGDYGSHNTSIVLNQALHWNGRRWSPVPIPNPGRTAQAAFDELGAVRCSSPADCWAVGLFAQRPGPENAVFRNEALHWNGRRWSQVTTPDPGGTGATAFNGLFGVACASSSNCWAIGSYGTSGVKPQTRLNQALHWNGRKWSQVSAPNPDGTATGASNVLIDATCTSPASCWAVGEYGNRRGGTGAILNQALHWNGRRWSPVSTPDPGGRANGRANFLAGIRCPSPASCWAVGDTEAFGHQALNLVLHWNGHRWSAG